MHHGWQTHFNQHYFQSVVHLLVDVNSPGMNGLWALSSPQLYKYLGGTGSHHGQRIPGGAKIHITPPSPPHQNNSPPPIYEPPAQMDETTATIDEQCPKDGGLITIDGSNVMKGVMGLLPTQPPHN